MKVLIACGLIVSMSLVACSKNDSSDSPATSPAESDGLTPIAISVPNAAPIVKSVTPAGMESAGSSFLANEIDCDGTTTAGTPARTACTLTNDVRSMIFGTPSSAVLNILAATDQRINSELSRSTSSYIACLDPENTAGGTFTDSNQTKTYPAYKTVDLTTEFSMPDGTSVDLGFDYKLNCLSYLNDKTYAVGLGKDGDNYYLRESQKTNPISVLAKVDARENAEIFAIVGEGLYTYPFDEQYDAPGTAGNSYDNGGSIFHLVAQPEKNRLEVTMTSIAAGVDCGGHILMNDKAMVIKANLNRYLRCSSTDVDAASTYRPYDATLVDKIFCFSVDGTLPVIQSDLTLCKNQGLIDEDTGLPSFSLTSLDRTKLKAWNTSFMFGNFTGLDTVPENVYVPIAVNAGEKKIDGLQQDNIFFERASVTADAVTAACNAIPATPVAVSGSFTISVDTYLEGLMSKMQKSGSTVTTESKTIALLNLSNRAQAVSEKPSLQVSLARTVGTSYSSDFSVTATVSLDGVALGSVELKTPSDASTAIVEGSIAVDMTNVKADSTFTVSYEGTQNLKCNASTSTQRTSKIDLGIPRLLYYWDDFYINGIK